MKSLRETDSFSHTLSSSDGEQISQHASADELKQSVFNEHSFPQNDCFGALHRALGQDKDDKTIS